MARIASLVGKTVTGDWFDIACGEDMQKIVDAYYTLRNSNGVAARGRGEVKLSEARLLANHTAGGEMKPRLRFVV